MDSDKSKLNLLPSLTWWLPRGSALQRALPSQQALTHNLRGKRWHNTHCSLFASAFLFIFSLAKDNQTVPLGNLVLLYYLLSQLIFLFIFFYIILIQFLPCSLLVVMCFGMMERVKQVDITFAIFSCFFSPHFVADVLALCDRSWMLTWFFFWN